MPAGMMPPALPTTMMAPITDDTIMAYRDELDRAERTFSDEAQVMGLGPAFARHGSADATNFGGPDDVAFVVGADAIARSVSANQPEAPAARSPGRRSRSSSRRVAISGSASASSCRTPNPNQERGPGFPFFTIWRRAAPGNPWRYVAE